MTIAFAGFCMFFACVELLLLVLSLTHVLLNRPLAWGVFIVSLVWAIFFARRVGSGGLGLAPEVPEPVRAPGRADVVMKVVLLLIVIAAVQAHLQAWVLAVFRAPHTQDGLAYHVPAIHEYVRAGRIAWVPATNLLVNAFPKGIEAFSFLMFHILGTDVLVNGSNLWFVPMGVLGLVIIARSFGVPGLWSWLVGTLFLVIPVNIAQGPICYVDLAFASTMIALIATMCLMLRKPSPVNWLDMVLWGANAGLMLGAKGTGAPFVGLSGIALLWIGFVRRRDQSWRRWVAGVALASAVALALGSYWYVRNLIFEGNPIYPYHVDLGPWRVFQGISTTEEWVGWSRYAMQNAGDSVLILKWPRRLAFLATWLQLKGTTDYLFGGIGYFWLVAALPSIVWVWLSPYHRRRKSERRALALVTLLIGVMFVWLPGRWWSRLTIWIYALGLPCFGLAFYAAWSSKRSLAGRIVTLLVMLATVIVALAEGQFQLSHEWRGYRRARFTSGVSSLLVPPTLKIHFIVLSGTVFEEVMESDRLARNDFKGYADYLTGLLSLPLGRRDIDILPESPTLADISRLHAKGTEWVIWDVESPTEEFPHEEPPEILKRHAVFRRKLHIGAGFDIHVIRLAKPGEAGGGKP